MSKILNKNINKPKIYILSNSIKRIFFKFPAYMFINRFHHFTEKTIKKSTNLKNQNMKHQNGVYNEFLFYKKLIFLMKILFIN